MTTPSSAGTTSRDISGYEVLGRLLMAVRGTDLAEMTLDYWLSGDGGVVLEWADGPTGDEARRYLLDQAVASGGLDVSPDDFTLDPDKVRSAQGDRVHVLMRGVKVQFRDLDPIGLEAALARVDAERRGFLSRR